MIDDMELMHVVHALLMHDQPGSRVASPREDLDFETTTRKRLRNSSLHALARFESLDRCNRCCEPSASVARRAIRYRVVKRTDSSARSADSCRLIWMYTGSRISSGEIRIDPHASLSRQLC